jgi:hypothetical protein
VRHFELKGRSATIQECTSWPVAIWCQSSSCTIADNVIHDAEAGTGVYLNDSPATVTANVFTAVGFGVDAAAGSDATVSQNMFENCAGAINAVDSSPVADGNTISRTSAFACRE